MAAILQFLTGARSNEQRKTLLCFLSLFFVTLSYYLIKPLRQSSFLADFDPTALRFVYLVTPFVSLAVTRLFGFFYERIDRYRLILYTYGVIMGCKVAFTWILPYGGKIGTVLFYFWASAYFLLALPAMWACINDIFTPEQGERCFGFVAMGATTGGLAGSALSSVISDSTGLRDYATLFSAASMGISLAMVLTAAYAEVRRRALLAEQGIEEVRLSATYKPKGLAGKDRPATGGFWGDVRDLWSIPYVRSIAIMVVCLALYNTTTTFLSSKVIDENVAQTQYVESYAEFNRQLNQKDPATATQPDALNVKGEQLIYSLKSVAQDKVDAEVQQFVAKAGLPGEMAQSVLDIYPKYHKDLEGKTRKLFSQIYLYQGIMGIFLLAGVSRFLFRSVGLRFAACILPCFALVSLIAWTTPINAAWAAVILVIGGALNYSLNNATKELLYTVTSRETKFKYKPWIDGPGQRLGGLSASLLSIVFAGDIGLRHLLGYSASVGEKIFLAVVFVAVAFWMKSVYFVGGEYDRIRQDQKAARDDSDSEECIIGATPSQ